MEQLKQQEEKSIMQHFVVFSKHMWFFYHIILIVVIELCSVFKKEMLINEANWEKNSIDYAPCFFNKNIFKYLFSLITCKKIDNEVRN